MVVPVTSPPEPTAEDSKSSTTIHGTFEPSGGIINEFIAIEKQNKKGVITKCVSKVKYQVINHKEFLFKKNAISFVKLTAKISDYCEQD